MEIVQREDIDKEKDNTIAAAGKVVGSNLPPGPYFTVREL